MTSVLSHRSIAAFKPLVLVAALATLTFPVAAQIETAQQLAPVTVSESRFESDSSASPIGATVITAEQIREAGIGNVNEAVRKIGGVYGRQSMTGGSDYQLDMRGFGGTGDQNIVVLIDGIRISEKEGATTLMSSIAIDSVERIEVVRGGSSVLYGEGATGGTINIVTNKVRQGNAYGSVFAEVGSFNSREVRASIAKKFENLAIDAAINTIDTDNYRQNNDYRQRNFNTGLSWVVGDTKIGARVATSRQDFGLAGPLTWDEFQNSPRKTNSPLDKGYVDSDRYSIFAEQNFGALKFAAELAHVDRTAAVSYSGAPASTYKGNMTQFSPRLKYLTTFGSVKSDLVVGLDFSKWDRTNVGVSKGTQDSKAIYARNEFVFEKGRIAVGGRHEKFDSDYANTGFGTPAYDRSFSVNAWDIQGSYPVLKNVDVFAKVGNSFRVANIDDNNLIIANTPLAPQKSKDLEIGAKWINEMAVVTARLFRHRLTNEIMFDAGLNANVNLDPTKRQGAEIEASSYIAPKLKVSGSYQHVSAKFTSGVNEGNEVVLVPENILTARLSWMPNDWTNANVGVQRVSSQRSGGDFDNACTARISSFTTLDARYALRFGTWEFAVSGTNLTDENYFTQSYGGGAFVPCRDGIYPEAGRALKVSVRKSF